MNGVALLLAAASLAVDYSWEKNSAGQVEYMVRVEAEVIPNLVSGEEIHSDVPAEAGTVERFRLRVGIDGNQPVFTPAAPTRYGVAPDKSAMLVKSGAAAVETQAVSFGWQPNTEGKLLYYVQIDPSLLRSLEAGDEIQANVDTSAGPVATFVVFGGNKQLPRIPTGDTGASGSLTGTAAGTPPSRFSPAGEPSPAAEQPGSRFGNADGATTPAAATEPASGGSRFGGAPGSTTAPGAAEPSSPPPSRFGGPTTDPATPPADTSRFGGAGNSNTQPRYGGSTNNSTINDGRSNTFNPPPLENRPPAGSIYGNSGSGQDSNFNRPPQGSGSDLYPSNTSAGTYRNPPVQEPPQRGYDNRPTLDPPPQGTSANRPLPPAQGSAPQNPPPAASQPPAGSAPAPDRMAMVDPNTTRAAGGGFATPPAAAPAAEAEKPWWWGWLVFMFCVMCLSIGGNLYLGWTAVEFYHRYQRAVERLRSGTSTARI